MELHENQNGQYRQENIRARKRCNGRINELCNGGFQSVVQSCTTAEKSGKHRCRNDLFTVSAEMCVLLSITALCSNAGKYSRSPDPKPCLVHRHSGPTSVHLALLPTFYCLSPLIDLPLAVLESPVVCHERECGARCIRMADAHARNSSHCPVLQDFCAMSHQIAVVQNAGLCA